MSSPPAEFPSSDIPDVEMGDGTGDQSMSQAPPPLFLAGTPSTTRGTPTARRSYAPESSPLRHMAVRRAAAAGGNPPSTPRRTPLFEAGSSSPMAFPSSSPMKAPRRRVELPSDAPLDSDPLDFPSTPRTPRNRRGDINSSLSFTPTQRPRQTQRALGLDPDNLRSDASIDIPTSSAGVNLLSVAPLPTDDEPDEIRAIWGTTVNLADTMRTFKEFLRGFKPKYRAAYDREHGKATRPFRSPEEGEVILYETYLRRMRQTGETNLNLDVLNLMAYPPAKKLYNHLTKYPQEVIPAMDQVLKDEVIEVAERDQNEGREGMRGEEGEQELAELLLRVYKIRPFGLNPVNMRDLNPTDTDKLVAIKGLVIRTTPIIPDMKTAFFRCLTCSHTIQQEIDRGKISEPQQCPRPACSSLGTLTLIHNRCEFADRQIIRLQETPDVVPDGQTPHTVTLSVYDELVDVCKPGDRVAVTGVFRSTPVRVDVRKRTMRSLFRTFIDVVHIRIGGGPNDGQLALDRSTRPVGGDKIPGVGGGQGRGLGVVGVGDGGMEEGDVERSEEDGGGGTRRQQLEERLKELSIRPDIYDLLARSLAPSIWEMEDVKKGILLQLFGGTNKSISKGGGGGGPRYRGDINVLLVGDPGVSKSQILQYVHKIAPRGVYTSGKSSSAVGLTAYVSRDPDSKQLVLQSGALVLSDGGVCCIDEFDKMSDATRSVLHEVMEQQTVSIAKAGIITTLNARTSILAAANPIGSKYDPNLPVTRNIDLPPTLISRFDLLYLVLDQVNEILDRRLAQHLVGLYLEDTPMVQQDILPITELSAYIEYARNKIHPVITEDAGGALVSAYVDMRNMGDDPRASEKRITATTRQLESMIRLSEAHARMRFSSFVEVQDVKEATRLMKEAIRTSAMDPRTGKIDMGMLNTGTGTGQRRLREDMRKGIMSVLEKEGGGRGELRWADVVKLLKAQSSVLVDAVEFAEAVKEMENEGSVKVVGEREKRVIRKM